MVRTPADLFAFLARLGIPVETVEHEPVFTVAEAQALRGSVPGAHTKNLFLEDKRGRLFLVVAPEDAPIDLKTLRHELKAAGRLSFASAERLRERLGVEPGSVTPLAALNDTAGAGSGDPVTVVLDEALLSAERINVHPLVNTMTVGLAPADLVTFLAATGHEPVRSTLPRRNLPATADDCQAEPAPPS